MATRIIICKKKFYPNNFVLQIELSNFVDTSRVM
jgi:hypothetical protein